MSKKYRIDNTIFEKIDSKEKAYWLGFLYADGYTVFDEKKYSYKIGLKLSNIDFKHLENFRYFINTTQPIKTIIPKKEIYIGNRKIDNSSGFCELTISNKKMTQDLINLGCFPKKSFTLEFPQKTIIPDIYLKHFIRGYFDGDGCLSLKKSNKNISIRGEIIIVSSDIFLKTLKSIIEDKFNFNTSEIKNLKNDKIFRLSLSGNVKLEIFLDWLYSDTHDNIRLDRKYKKYLELKKLRERAISYRRGFSNLKTLKKYSNLETK